MKGKLHAVKPHDGNRRQAPGAIKASHASSLRNARRCSAPDKLPGAAPKKAKPASEGHRRLNAELFAAVGSGDLASVGRLIEKGADVNAMDRNGTTVLMQAALLGHKLIARLLVANGADVNARDARDWTAYGLAGFSGHFGIRNMLAQHGGQK
jgi:ankyrin repeat protein